MYCNRLKASKASPKTLREKLKRFGKGDTLVEVMFAVGVFGLVSIGALSVMNRGLTSSERSLELTMARSEIDSEAEALRFLHSAYISEKNSSSETYTKIWQSLVSLALPESSLKKTTFFSDYDGEVLTSCESYYSNFVSGAANESKYKSFVINPRLLDGETLAAETFQDGSSILANIIFSSNLLPTSSYPRLIFTSDGQTQESDQSSKNNQTGNPDSSSTLSDFDDTDAKKLVSAEGITIVATFSDRNGAISSANEAEYFDFYIRTCWDALGSGAPSTISTTIRLYNPDL